MTTDAIVAAVVLVVVVRLVIVGVASVVLAVALALVVVVAVVVVVAFVFLEQWHRQLIQIMHVPRWYKLPPSSAPCDVFFVGAMARTAYTNNEFAPLVQIATLLTPM